MFRGGGAGGGAGSAFGGQVFDLLGALLGLPSGELVRFLIGLLLVVAILWLIRRLPAPRARAAAPSSTCLLCGQELKNRTYIDRYLPSWAACGDCYDRLTPRQQRQYRTR